MPPSIGGSSAARTLADDESCRQANRPANQGSRNGTIDRPRQANPVLGAEPSAALRDQLLKEINDLTDGDDLALWAHRRIAAKIPLRQTMPCWRADRFRRSRPIPLVFPRLDKQAAPPHPSVALHLTRQGEIWVEPRLLAEFEDRTPLGGRCGTYSFASCGRTYERLATRLRHLRSI